VLDIDGARRGDADGPAILVEGLVKVYPGPPEVRAVDGIDLEVQRGETFGLLGPNGAGKTTTVGACTTRVRPSEGRVVVDGIDVAAHPSRAKAHMGVVTQFNTLDRALSVWQNLYFHCRYFGMARVDAKRRADELLERFRLADRAIGMTIALSGGMAQRLQLARAVAHRPRVLFLDEPTAGLDPQSRLALWEMVDELKREGVTVLLTTHYMEEADSLCSRVAIVDHGRMIACGPPAELRRSLGAETVISLHVGDTAGLEPKLAALAGVVRVEPSAEGLRVLARSADRLVPQVVELALPHHLSDVSVNEPTLETVFISLTGRELRD
jgi:ABC-2 type transport system ATP-binding protein